MVIQKTPAGLLVNVPENTEEDPSVKFSIGEVKDAHEYYSENGYVVFKHVFSAETCDEVREVWNSSIKTHDGEIYRQATSKLETNKFNEQGWVMNPILNLQSLNPKYFKRLRTLSVEKILSDLDLSIALQQLLGDEAKLVQSMYFEGNSATWEHQDTYYLDSEKLGAMVAGWIALEDIAADAGRFFVCPKSHLIDMGLQSKENNVIDNHDIYIESIVSVIERNGLEIRAPRMEAGDVLLWNSRTIHGSLDSTSKINSRSSITCHFIPQSFGFLQFQSRLLNTPYDQVKQVKIFRAKDLARFRNKFIFWIESTFPRQFYWIKGIAVKAVVSRKKAI